MKKLFAILLALVTVFSFCACNPNDGPGVGGDVDAESLLSDAFIDPVNGWKVYDDLIAQIKAETDYAKRAELMHKAEDILFNEWVLCPIYYYVDVYMLNEAVEGAWSSPLGYKYFMYANVK